MSAMSAMSANSVWHAKCAEDCSRVSPRDGAYPFNCRQADIQNLWLPANTRRVGLNKGFSYLSASISRPSIKSSLEILRPIPMGPMDERMNGYPLRATTHMPDDTVSFGNWNELIVVTWGAIALEIDTSTGFAQGTTGFRAIVPIDFGVHHPESFVKSSLS